MSSVLSRHTLTRRAGLKALLFTAAALTVGFASAPGHAEDKAIKVGIMGGEDEDVWKAVAEQGKKHGLNIELVTFNDYNQPNEALDRKEIDANAFQHKPYLDEQIKQHGYKISVAGYTAVWPIGIYSRKHKSLDELKEGAVVGVPNDPSNEGRAIKVLEEKGLIKLRPEAGILATPIDVTENPKKIEIKELDAGVVGRSIDDLDAAVVNNDWAAKAGLTKEEAIAWESKENNPYNNFIAVRTDDLNEQWVKDLVTSFQSDAVKAALDTAYKGTAIPAWN
ncbi:D-methionine transport system substrate-binding protein [Ochrobactrum daejeonense]|uniref:Lipoprotein n=1 Tax=Brucella daejeonensis TaxID=659015 RepID=A0A7W9AZ84_9HYPH|nr:MetQ/NlpA family ABC transporter substrate-binding protein [Brucella daejeonensis]MBB5703162.1 D-methionine transport system substrate-binding protein [Brucella daejeonensis]NKB79216.1 MetQ/NlpA family ABC transporter substrate-binding protein [Brucella daejeonensis]